MEILYTLIVSFAGYLLYNAIKSPKPTDESIKLQNTVILSPDIRSVTMAEKKAAAPKAAKKETTTKTAKPAAVKAAVVKPENPEVNMSELVGLTAGDVWRYLDANGAVTVATLVKSLAADEKIIQRSIGWLAQEGKIDLESVDRAETIQLRR